MATTGGFSGVHSEGVRKSNSREEYEANVREANNRDNESKIKDEAWIREMKSKVLNLRTTNDELFDLAEYATKSPELMHMFQMAISLRNQIVEALTNLAKSLHDTARSIIANLRS